MKCDQRDDEEYARDLEPQLTSCRTSPGKTSATSFPCPTLLSEDAASSPGGLDKGLGRDGHQEYKPHTQSCGAGLGLLAKSLLGLCLRELNTE